MTTKMFFERREYSILNYIDTYFLFLINGSIEDHALNTSSRLWRIPTFVMRAILWQIKEKKWVVDADWDNWSALDKKVKIKV